MRWQTVIRGLLTEAEFSKPSMRWQTVAQALLNRAEVSKPSMRWQTEPCRNAGLF